jgi:cell division septum initiation protein DivIVA
LDTSQSAQEEDTSLQQITLEALQQDIQQLKNNTDNLLSAVSGNTHMATQIQLQMATLSAEQSANERHISALATAQMNSIGIFDEIELLKVLDLLSRANQFLLHSNYGQAKQILQSALIELTELQERLPGFQQEAISSILDLVEQTIIDLPTKPTLAAEKLELAWQLGITGLPKLGYGEFVGTVTPTPYLTPTPTPP